MVTSCPSINSLISSNFCAFEMTLTQATASLLPSALVSVAVTVAEPSLSIRRSPLSAPIIKEPSGFTSEMPHEIVLVSGTFFNWKFPTIPNAFTSSGETVKVWFSMASVSPASVTITISYLFSGRFGLSGL